MTAKEEFSRGEVVLVANSTCSESVIRANCFIVDSPQCTLFLAAETPTEKDSWVKMIRRAIQLIAIDHRYVLLLLLLFWLFFKKKIREYPLY